MKKKFFFKFFLFTVIATMVTFTACKDYDDDISDLQNQITNLSSVKTDLDGVKADIASALAKANEALTKAEAAGDAEAIKAAKDAADKAQKAADELLPRIEELEAAINAMDSVSQEDLDALVVEIDGLREQFAEITGSGLLNFVLIPDYVFKDGATGIALFNQLDASECGMISAPTTLRYRVSPTSASEEMIDVEGMRFEFNAPKTRAEEAPKFTAEFVSLKDGVLTIKAHMATDALKDIDEDGDVQPQIQLIVAAASGEEVITDWVSVQTESIGDDLYIANSQFEADRDEDFVWSEYEFFTDLAALKAEIDKEADHVVEVQYNQAFDLIDVVNTLFDTDKELNLEDYGLSYSFDLKYTDGEEDKDIEYLLTKNETDQQDFIRLSDEAKGTVKSKVYTNENSRTAIGRTPIVRVQLMNDDCVVETAYIKINWVEEAKEPVPALELELDATAAFVCEAAIDNVLKGVVDVDWMNVKVYDHFDMTKPEFHDAYEIVSGVEAYNADGDPLGYPGTAYDLSDEGSEATHLVRWKFNPSDNSMTPETNVVTGHINYVEKGTDKVAVTIEVTLTITFPEFSLYGHNSTYWNADRSLFTVNPLIYDTEGADTTVDIYTSLLDGFRDKDQATPESSIDLIKSSVEGVTPGAVKFVFDEKALEESNYTIVIEGVEYSYENKNLALNSTKTDLYAGSIIAARIVDNTIMLGEDGKVNNDASEQLVGKTLPVKLVVDLCGDSKVQSTVKDFDVYFIDPIKINGEFEDTFEDLVPGGSKISIAEALTLTDFNGYTVRKDAFTEDENPTNKQKIAHLLYDYYVIGETTWGILEATTNLKEDANGDLVPVDGFKDGILSKSYSITDDGDNLVFMNTGSKLIEPFVIYIPVTISHKWGEVSSQVAITVNPSQE